MGWICRMKKSLYRIFVEKPEGKRLFRKFSSKQKNNTETYLNM
jgi:hypothetical protein